MGGGNIPPKEMNSSPGGNIPASGGSFSSTSDNQYLSNFSMFSTSRAAWLLGIGTRRIRQIAEKFQIGDFEENRWRFSWEHLTLLDKHIKKGKRRSNVSREDVVPNFVHGADVAPRSIDELLSFVSKQFPMMRRQFMDLVAAAMEAAHNELIKEQARHEKMIQDLWLDLQELRKKLQESGWGVSLLGGAAPRPPTTVYAARAA